MCCTIDRHIYPGLITCLAITKKVQIIVHSHPANSGIKVRQYMCLSIMKHIGGSILATTHYPRFYVIILIYIISWWSFSWYFGTSFNHYHQQQSDLATTIHRFIYLFLLTFRHAPSKSQIAHFLLGKSAIFAYFWASYHRSTVIFQIFLCQHDMYTCVQLLVQ